MKSPVSCIILGMKKHLTFKSLFWVAAVSLVSGGVSAEGVKCGRVALHTWLTSAEFKDISVTAAAGRTLWKGLPDPAKCGAKAGQWEVADGVLRQKDVSARDTALVFGEESWTDYTFKAKARTLEGDPAFRLKLLKFGLSRGFAYDEVDAAIRGL